MLQSQMTAVTDGQDSADPLRQHFSATAFRARVPALVSAFQTHGYVALGDFAPPSLHGTVLRDIKDLFESAGQRRDVHIASTGHTPRFYTHLDRDTIARENSVIPAIFRSPSLLELLREIAGQDVLPAPYLPEEFVASRLTRSGDVHGWHWDDYTFALIWVLQAAPEGSGGSLEYVKDTSWDKANPQVDHYVATRPIERAHPPTGSAYLLKADTALHRVSPVSAGAERIVVCFSYATLADLDREISHETMQELYPDARVA